MSNFGYLVEELFKIVANISNVILDILLYTITINGQQYSIIGVLTGAGLITLVIILIVKGLIS